jgi:predicted nucleic acid-binding protein
VTIIVLDSGPLGLVTNPKNSSDAKAAKDWLDEAIRRKDRIVIAEIVDYELRCELFRAGKVAGLRRLDAMLEVFEYLPLTTPAMREAAELWAEVRKSGKPTAANAALDGDVVLAAQTITAFQTSATIATSNVAHLSRFVRADLWSNIS